MTYSITVAYTVVGLIVAGILSSQDDTNGPLPLLGIVWPLVIWVYAFIVIYRLGEKLGRRFFVSETT